MSTTSSALISIIIRTKNEERWISSCLRAVFDQTYKNIEIILVDNCSTDQTVKKAQEYPVKLVEISEFLPGKAINDGIRASSGEIIVCLSGHCIPTNSRWLENLIQDLYLENVAGVYGRQEPLAFSSDIDKRDLLIVFGLDKKIQLKDPFFHNANSAFLRETWEKFPFDEVVTNIEDRVWGQSVIDSGMKIIYEPEASVYHWHGIHQDLNLSRARNIVRIIEETQNIQNSIFYDNENQEVVALIPIRGESLMARNQTLLRYTIDAAKASRLITRIVVSTDNANTANLAKALGAEVPFIRPHNLSEEYVDIAQVLQYSLIELERKSKTPDLVVLLEEAYPFRRAEILDLMIDRFNEEGLDSLIAVIPESRAILKRADDKIEVVDDGFMPRKMKQYHAMVGLLGFATVVHPSVLRKGDLFGKNIGVYEIEDIFSSLEVSNESLFIKALGYLDKQ